MFNFINFYKQNYLLILLAALLSACATTSNKEGTEVLDGDDIVISEEFGIDTALRDKFEKATKLIKDKKFEAAVELLVEVTDHTDKHSAPYINLAIAYSELGKAEQAEKILLRAKKINPRHPVTNNELGLLYRKSGRFTESKAAYEKVIKHYPQFLPARKNLGILCDLFMADLDCAISHYEIFLKYQPHDKEVIIWLADLKSRAGK